MSGGVRNRRTGTATVAALAVALGRREMLTTRPNARSGADAQLIVMTLRRLLPRLLPAAGVTSLDTESHSLRTDSGEVPGGGKATG